MDTYLVFGCEVPAKDFINMLDKLYDGTIVDELVQSDKNDDLDSNETEAEKLLNWFSIKHQGNLLISNRDGYRLMSIKNRYYLVLRYTVDKGSAEGVKVPSKRCVEKFKYFIHILSNTLSNELDLKYRAILIPGV